MKTKVVQFVVAIVAYSDGVLEHYGVNVSCIEGFVSSIKEIAHDYRLCRTQIRFTTFYDVDERNEFAVRPWYRLV